MKKNNLKKLTLKEKIQRIDFILMLLIGVAIFLLCTKNSTSYYGDMKFGICWAMFVIIFSHARWKYVYGTEEYRKRIRDNYKKFNQITSIPSKNLVLAIIWCGSLTPIITNLAQEKYFNSLLALMFAISFSLILSKMIDVKLKQEKILGVKSKKVKFSYDYRAIVLLPIIIIILLFSSFSLLLKGEFLASLLIFIITVFLSLILSFSLRK